MQKPERSSYSTNDFRSWRAPNQLSISPRFQRRKVWGQAARSYLIDTLILGYPVPPIYLRIVKQRGKKLPVREVIDGQQRISAVLDFIDGDFPLSRNIESPYVGKRFDDLPINIQDDINTYSFICEVLQGISDPEVLSIFGRLNSYSVRLNGQELRNGRYFGPFKQSAYALAYSHLTFWRNNRIFSDVAVARMREVELTSELMIALIAGMQDKKKSVDSYYSRFDEIFVDRKKIESRFRKVIDEINDIFEFEFDKTEFKNAAVLFDVSCVSAPNVRGSRRQACWRWSESTFGARTE